MGRPRKHAAVHQLDGTYIPVRHDLGADNIPSPGECVPTRRLNVNGQKFFDVVVGAFPAGTMGAGESEALTECSEWVQRMFRLREVEEETGEMLIREAGEISKHIMQYCSKFGLTPADRGKVKLVNSAQDNKSDKFFGATG